MRRRWVDRKRFSFDDICVLSGFNGGYLQSLRIRRWWTPQYPPQHGGAERKTYTPRDVLHAMAIGSAVGVNLQQPFGGKNGSYDDILAALIHVLDPLISKAVDLGQSPHYTFACPRPKTPWIRISFNLAQLVDTQLPKLKAYRSDEE
jgi:hypothetical protein